MPNLPEILDSADDGSEGGQVLRGVVYGGFGCDSGRPAISHHFQCGGGCGGASLGVRDGGGRVMSGQAWTIG